MPVVSTGQFTITDVNDGVGLVILPTSLGFTYVDGVATPADQWIGFTVQRQGPISGFVSWYASNGATLVTDAGQVSALSMSLGLYGAEDGNTCFMHVSQVTSDEPVTVTALVGEVSAATQVVRLHKSTAAAGANQTYVDANGNIQGVSSGSGTQVDNSVAIGDMMNSGGGLLPNWNLNLSDASGKPAGIYGVEGIADRSGIQFGDASRTWVKLSHPTDTTIAYGFPAIPIDDRRAYVFRVRHKTNSASPPANGLYYYFIEKAGALDVGKTHVIRGGGDTTIGSLETSVKYVYFNGAYPSNSGWTETTDLVYVPTAGTRFASFSIASWNFATSVELHIDAVYLTSLSSTVYRQTTQPTGGIYVKGDVWINTGSTDTPMRHFDGTAWQLVSNYVTNTNQLTDGAGLGGTATWSGVSGAGKPLDNAGQVLDTRNDNLPPNSYVKGNHREFKFCSVVGITTSATYCVVETIKGWGDSSGGEATQWAYVSSGEVWKRSAPAGATTWNAWVRDLDLGLYTGALNATNNAVGQGTLATRPTGTDGDFYYATDTGAMYQKIAGAWVLSSNNTSIDASGNIQGVSGGAGQSVANNGDSVIRAPAGGVFVTTAGTLTGALKIKLPQLSSSTMIRFTVDIYEYLAGYSCSIELAGYNHSSGWINVTARVIGGSNVEYPVRFGRDADKNCIWVGNSNETWSYPQVRVRDVFLGYSNYSAAQWSSGWVISFDTTALTAGAGPNQYSAQVLDTLPGADWAKTSGANRPEDNATVGAPPGTNVGSTPAETVEGNANNAYNALTDPETGLNQRMRINADNVLGGVLIANTTSAPVGVRVGTVSWSADGTVIDGTGVAITPKGVYARNPAKTTFVLDATTGDATFSGNLTGANITGATGTFSGSLTAETLGSLAQAPVTITSTQTITVPAGMNSVRYELVGGGGGGGGGATGFVEGYGGGGGSGAYMSGTLSVTPGASLTITIGSGGAGGANTLAGGNGTASSIGALVTAAGGTGGGGSAANAGYGTGGATSTSVPTNSSKPGNTAAKTYNGTKSTYAGFGTFNGAAKYDGAGFPIPEVSGAGGSNPKGTGGASISTGLGLTGSGYGSGGSGGGGSTLTNASAVGGAGKPGLCILTFVNTNGVVLQGQFESLKQVLAAQGIAVA